MSTLKDRLKVVMDGPPKISQAALARACKVTAPSVNDWRSGKTKTLEGENLLRAADFLRVNPQWLATGKGPMRLDGPQPSTTSNTLGEPVELRGGSVPVVGTAKLGPDGYFDELGYPAGYGDGYVLISSSDENAYALRVIGDSMEPRIRSGEFVMVEPSKPYFPGDDVLVQFKDGTLTQSVVKVFMYERDGLVRLLSVNDTHAPMSIERERILKIHSVGAILKPSRYVAG